MANTRARFRRDLRAGTYVVRRFGRATISSLVFAVITSLASPGVPTVVADEGQQKPRVKLSRSLTVNGPKDGKVHEVELGELPVDALVEIELKVINEGTTAVQFDDVEMSCSCLRVTLEHAIVQPAQSGDCKIELDTSKRQSRHLMSTPIKFSSSKEPNRHAVVILKGFLQGFLSFEQPWLAFQIDEDKEQNELVVPFVATEPVKGDLVSVDCKPEVLSYRIERAERGQPKWNLILTVDSSQIKALGSPFALRVDDFVTGRTAECTLVVQKESPITIRPVTVRLVPEKDGAKYRGNVIVTVRRSEEASGEDYAGESKESGNEPIVTATFGDKRLPVKLHRLNDEHFRISFFINEKVVEQSRNEDDNSFPKIHWGVSSRRGSYRFSTPVSVSNFTF